MKAKKPTTVPHTTMHVLMGILTIVIMVLVGTTVYLLMNRPAKPTATSQKQPAPQVSKNDDTEGTEFLTPTATSTANTTIVSDDDLVMTTTTPISFADPQVRFTPRVPVYRFKPDLSDVVRADELDFSPEQQQMLAKNGFAVTPSVAFEFYPLYETDRYEQMPFFVTTDSLAHSYHLLFSLVLKRMEEQKLSASLIKLTDRMLAVSLDQYNQLKGTAWEEPARRNVGFFSVAKLLNDPRAQTPDMVKDQVTQELALIEAHAGRTSSPLFPQLQEDYSQYVPRSHYTKSEQLKAYFKSMMWYGRIGFNMTRAEDIRSAALMTMGLRDAKIRLRWQQITDPISFIVGQSDDSGWAEFEQVMKNAFPDSSTLAALTKDTAGFAKLTEEVKNLPKPQINSGHISDTTINRETEFRFMGQRFTMDASIFQQLIHDKVPGRMLPEGLDIPAAYGSEEAGKLIADSINPIYISQMAAVKKSLAEQTVAQRTATLYGSWMYALQPLASPAPKGYPWFMLNQAWTRKQLATYLASWTELKHDTVLYAKQAYAAEMGGSPEEPPQKDDRGYVEPQPLFYARLAALADMTIQGLGQRNLLDDKSREALQRMSALSRSLQTISVKELENAKLSDDEYDIIRAYGGDLEHIWNDVQDNEGQSTLDTPAALVTDVATNPLGGEVLQEGTGYIARIYAVVPIDGKPHITQGGVFTHYEFSNAMSDRLTDEVWRNMLNNDSVPKMPAWTDAFITP